MTDFMTASPSGDHDMYQWQTIRYPVFAVCILVPVSVCTLAGNFLVITAVYRYQWLHMNTALIIASLGVCDLFIGAVLVPIIVTSSLLPGTIAFPRSFCLANQIILTSVSGLTLLHIFAINVDRFLAITQPFVYIHKVTRQRVGIFLICMWLTVSCATGLGTVLSDIQYSHHCSVEHTHKEYLVTGLVAGFFLPALCLVLFYIRIWRIAQTHHMAIQAQCQVSGTAPPLKNTNLKVVRSLAFVLGSYLISWTPSVLSQLVFICVNSDGSISRTHYYTHFVTMILCFSNSAQNPLIYAYCIPEFRAAFRHMVKRSTITNSVHEAT